MVLCCIVWIYVIFITYWNVNYGIIRKFDKKKISMQETLLGSNPLTQVNKRAPLLISPSGLFSMEKEYFEGLIRCRQAKFTV